MMSEAAHTAKTRLQSGTIQNRAVQISPATTTCHPRDVANANIHEEGRTSGCGFLSSHLKTLKTYAIPRDSHLSGNN